MRISEHELKIRRLLTEARVDSPGLCARLLTAHVAGLNKTAYILASNDELPATLEVELYGLAARRASGEPLAYIFGQKEFYGLDFSVSQATLTPRPETELVVDLALRLLPATDSVLLADLGCGSGCIGLTLLKLRPNWQGVLLDNSREALLIAARNNSLHGLSAALVEGDLFHLPLGNAAFDLVVSNPPYIALSEIGSVMAETLAYEPYSALFSPENGLAHLQAVITQAAFCLKPGGYIILEHGFQQGRAVIDLLDCAGFEENKDHCDLADLPRCAVGRKK